MCGLGFHDETAQSAERQSVPSALYGLTPSQMAAMGLTGEGAATLRRRKLGDADAGVRNIDECVFDFKFQGRPGRTTCAANFGIYL